MERFLRYSLERNRAIRLIYLDEENKMRQVNAVVEGLDGGQVKLYILRPPRKLTLATDRILSADYRKGDEGGE